MSLQGCGRLRHLSCVVGHVVVGGSTLFFLHPGKGAHPTAHTSAAAVHSAARFPAFTPPPSIPVSTIPTSPPTTRPHSPPTTRPPVTTPPTTRPPVTTPPTTRPPVTTPPVTRPPVTAPPTTSRPATSPPGTSPATTRPGANSTPGGTHSPSTSGTAGGGGSPSTTVGPGGPLTKATVPPSGPQGGATGPGGASGAGGAAAGKTRTSTRGQPAAGGLDEPIVIAGGGWQGVSLRAATDLKVPIAFGAVVGLFVLLQALVDRWDPKLSKAPERGDDDTVGFS